jgi:hypothetical protein
MADRGAGTDTRQPGGLELSRVEPRSGLEGLVVGDAGGIRADQADERVPSVLLDHEIDGGRALGIGEEEAVAGRRERTGKTLERDDRAVARDPFDEVAIGRAEAFREVDREALVEPVRRRVVRIVDRRREDQVAELVRHDDVDPRVVDLAGGDQREHRPDVGVGLAADVLAGPGTQRVVELPLVGVDEEVDRVGFGHAEERGRLAHGRVADLERPAAERIAALRPVDPDDVALEGLPVDPVIGVRVGQRRAHADRAVRGRDPPARGECRVRHDVAVVEVDLEVERALACRRRIGLDDARPGGVSGLQEDLDPFRPGRQLDRLVEGDRLPER